MLSLQGTLSRYHTSTKLKSLCWPKRLTVDASVNSRVDLLVWAFCFKCYSLFFVLIEIKFLKYRSFLVHSTGNFTNLTELRNALVDSYCYQYCSRPAASHIWCKVHYFYYLLTHSKQVWKMLIFVYITLMRLKYTLNRRPFFSINYGESWLYRACFNPRKHVTDLEYPISASALQITRGSLSLHLIS